MNAITPKLSLAVSFVILVLNACSQPQRTQHKPLCDRNVYSRNGVETVTHYDYSAREGVIDESSKTLSYIEKYDSLGNLIYYKGEYYPSIDVPFSTYFYKIRSALDLPWNETHSYKMEYRDTVFLKASMFNDNGQYIARVEQRRHNNRIEDSVYVREKLIYVQHCFKDTAGRDSLSTSYDIKYGEPILDEEVRITYKQLDDHTTLEEQKTKSKSFDFSRNHKYETSVLKSFVTRDDKGRVVKHVSGDVVTSTSKYDEKGNEVESTLEYHRRHSISLFKTEYYENGLRKGSYSYADMTVCDGKSEYVYTFYPYAPANLK